MDSILYIASDKFKMNFLQKINTINDVSFMTLSSFLDELTFKYDERSILYLMNKYSYDIDVCKVYLNNLRNAIILKDDSDKKVRHLLGIYQDLKDNNLLIFNPFFKEYLKKKKIVICDYCLKKEEEYYFNGFNYSFLETNNDIYSEKEISLCTNYEKELHFAFDKISSLLNDGIKEDDIFIIFRNDERLLLKKMAYYYDLNLNLNTDSNLYDILFTRKLLKELKDSKKIDTTLFNNFEREIYKKVVAILNGTCFNTFEMSENEEKIIIDKLKNTLVKKEYQLGMIREIKLNELSLYKDKYVFILGFNDDVVMSFNKDDDYFKDSLKSKYSFSTSYDINKMKLKKLKDDLLSIKNIYISYSKYSNGKEIYPFELISEMSMKINNFEGDYSLYSDKYNKYLLCLYKDEYYKYKAHSEGFARLLKTYEEPYRSYDNSFKGIDKKSFLKMIDNKISLSYSSLDTYSKCSFMYYIDKVLKNGNNESTFSSFLGNVFHDVLSKIFLEDEFDTLFNKAMMKYDYKLKPGEDILLEKYKNELKYIIDIIKYQYQYMSYNDLLYEEEVNILRDNIISEEKIVTNFKGFIDKILYKKANIDGEEKTLVSIIDYKTGNVKIDLSLMDYGLSMQLPIYMYLSKNINKLNNVVLRGFYLQNILKKEPDVKINEPEEVYDDQKRKSLKLSGYTVDDNFLPFDKTNDNSLIIDGLKKKKDGTYYQSSKILTSKQIDEIIDKTKDIIDLTFNNIYNCFFQINPKIVRNINESCTYCKYSDICFKTAKDYVYINNEVEENVDE